MDNQIEEKCPICDDQGSYFLPAPKDAPWVGDRYVACDCEKGEEYQRQRDAENR